MRAWGTRGGNGRRQQEAKGAGGGRAMRLRDLTEWLIAALRQFDCDSLRSIEGGECGQRGEDGEGIGIKNEKEQGGWRQEGGRESRCV